MKFNWGHGISLFLILFLGFAATFIIFSFKQNIDLVTKDYYKKGADYTNQMIINQRSQVFSDSISTIIDNNRVFIRVAPSISEMTDSLQLFFFRPSDKNLDYKCSAFIKGNQSGIDKNKLMQGRYLLTINWFENEDAYQVEKVIFIK